MPEDVLELLKQIVAVLIKLFECTANVKKMDLYDSYLIQYHTILEQIYSLHAATRKIGNASQYSLEENVAFYTFLEFLEKTQIYLANIIKNKQNLFVPRESGTTFFTRLSQRLFTAISELRSNIIEWQHSIKVTLSALITLLFWIFTGWQAAIIGTVSVLAVAQLNMYSSKSKAKSRILGCLLGGVVGMGLILLQVPTAIFYLLAIMVVAVFAYLSAGKNNNIDIGIQANVAFLTTVVSTWGAHLVVMPAIERLTGVLVGSSVAVAVSYFVWPLNPQNNIKKQLAANFKDFAGWLNLLASDAAHNAKQDDFNLLRKITITRLENIEALFVYVSQDNIKHKNQQLLELQYHLLFNLVVLSHNKTCLQTVVATLHINVNEYLHAAGDKLKEFAESCLCKPSGHKPIDINITLQLVRQQLMSIRKESKMAQYEVNQTKEVLVTLRNLIQLLDWVQRGETELAKL